MQKNPTIYKEQQELPTIQRVVSVLWPSFLVASLATVLFFSLFDPADLGRLAGYPELTRTGGYTIGFFAFWLMTAISCGMTCYFRKPVHRPRID